MMLKGKVAVVTGGASGIGEGICLELAKQGAKVAVTDINKEAAERVTNAIKENGGIASAYKLDVTDVKNIKEVGSLVKNEFGLVDIWVNSAGISIITPFFEHTEKIWDMTMDINLKGQFLCCKEAVSQMLEKGGGSIINMSSQSGKVGTNNYQAYCASKFGIIGLTQSLSKEFAKEGIKVNAICPGVVNTPMWEKQAADYGKKRNLKGDEVMDYFKSKIPAHRIGTVEDIAKLVVFLSTTDSDYITGQALNVNGGDYMA
ncbi:MULTISPECIES: SDR family NAD(P)-dependent oxidoreductase [Clostridium]|uniref:SDR family NAD(P)-dependent oxidoreductase n=1 Tax=Clostridium brassicae TaxID=2999072 RepID=A0ABT4D871_9CLOT|nr:MULTISPECIES: SDR family NAD(P)-dependent oxidoreductase [Clostridium]MCY6958494.1 SDR family NAD(P)-dependent oxidoreductase [Clostridium brassicae]WMJ81509.1 SDR family NAD(P)-dependent oxidoreductase [Clostridium sp. MB40-C1]